MPRRLKTRPKPIDRPLAGSRFAELLLRVHGKRRAFEIANEVATSRRDAGDGNSERVWRTIAAQVKRAPDDKRR